jgi:peptidoglycan/xylan/chitin deacetylase (PgdA/CDA1 family)
MMKELYPLAAFRQRKEEEFWRQMTEEQIGVMSSSPWVTIGSHGFYHNDLGRIPIPDAERELRLSRQFLEEWTGKPVCSFAFPYGTYTREAVKAALRAGYTQILALDYHHAEDRCDPAMRERFIVNPYISTENQMLATIKKTYAF